MTRLRPWYKFVLAGWIVFVGLSFVIAGVGYGWRLALYSYLFHVDTSNVGEAIFGVVSKLIIYYPIIALLWAFNSPSNEEP